MAYFVQLTLPKNTPRNTPVKHSLPVAPGVIRKVLIVHPTGCVSLVGVWIEYLSSKIFPVNDDGYFLGNGFPIEFYPDYEMDTPPFTLDICGYNDDDTYQHQPLIMLDVDFLTMSPIATGVLLQQLNEASE